ncbi:TPA: hypothetical protein DDZ10_03320 [Candidatus Uhrbacteria bacterium]|nr:hypothetical protein [Candidatus Uhrbacteria bacterium]
MRLFLTSAGMRMKHEIETFASELGKPVRCLYVTTASNPELDQTYVIRDRSVMENLGWEVEEIDLAGMSDEAIESALVRCNVVYVQGGNTFYLMKWIRESGFDRALRPWLERGGLYIGVSAGSIVVGTNMSVAGIAGGDANMVELKDLRGMGMVDLVISPHYEPLYEMEIAGYEREHGVEVTRLTDDQAVLVKDDRVEVVTTENPFPKCSS